ncbi:MAG: hypothetical protein ACKOAH_13015, partial [Pirellula sp.]
SSRRLLTALNQFFLDTAQRIMPLVIGINEQEVRSCIRGEGSREQDHSQDERLERQKPEVSHKV